MTNPSIEIRTLPASRGLEWFTNAFTMFGQAPAPWIIMGIAYMLIFVCLSLVPGLSIFAPLITTPLLGGLMLGCCRQRRRGEVDVGSLFWGFQQAGSRLALLGLLYLVGSFVATILVLIPALGAGTLSFLSEGTTPPIDAAYALLGFLALLLIILMPLIMAYFFAPALVAVAQVDPLAAMKMSFLGCSRNMLPFLAYGVVGLLLAIIASIPLGLGFILLTPVFICSMYLAFEDIFVPVESPTKDAE